MTENDPSFWQTIGVYVSSVVTWLTGEAGRMVIAGGLGGLYRWFMSETRRIRDGCVAVISGVISAIYFSPIVLAMIEGAIGDLGEGAKVQNTAAFAAGLVGMSVAKIVIALMESYTDRLSGKKND